MKRLYYSYNNSKVTRLEALEYYSNFMDDEDYIHISNCVRMIKTKEYIYVIDTIKKTAVRVY